MEKEQKASGLLPIEEELVYRVGWLIKLRWIAATTLLLSVTIVNYILKLPIEILPLLAIGSLIIAYNIVFKICFEKSKRNLSRNTGPFHRLANLQVATDWIALIFLIHYTGGIESLLVFCFVFHITISSILLSRLNCYWQVGFATCLLILLTLFDYLGIIGHVAMPFLPVGGFYDNPIAVGAVLLFLLAIMWTVMYLTTSVTVKLREREKGLFLLEGRLEEAYSKLEEVDEARSNFLLGVTHELRSPLASIGSTLSLFEEGYLGKTSIKQKRVVEGMQERVEFLLMLVMDLLKLTQLRERRPTQTRAKIDITKIINVVVDSLRAQAEYKGIDLQTQISSHPLYVWADAGEMELLISNLLANAIKYTSPKGNVQAKVCKQDSQVKMEVSDNGIGIAREEFAKIFKEFYRSDNAKEVDKTGTGLGLTIVKRVLEKYGGKIDVQSVVGKGSKFVFILPAMSLPKLPGR